MGSAGSLQSLQFYILAALAACSLLHSYAPPLSCIPVPAVLRFCSPYSANTGIENRWFGVTLPDVTDACLEGVLVESCVYNRLHGECLVLMHVMITAMRSERGLVPWSLYMGNGVVWCQS